MKSIFFGRAGLLLQVICVLSFITACGHSDKRTAVTADASSESNLKQFRDLKYGAFIHWTPTTQIGAEVSFSRNVNIPASAYDSLYTTFNPTGFNAEEWVKTLKEAGFRYVVFVPKHHDGFSMWDTRLSDYNIMHSAFKRDVIKEFAAACRKYHMPLCMYYSIVDYYQPDCIPYDMRYVGDYGGPGYQLPPGQEPDFDRYVQYMKGQLKELTENYGPFLGWWFDGGWQRSWTEKRGTDLFNYMRQLQPGVLMSHRVGTAYNDSVYLPTWFPDEKHRVGDYAVLEADLPRFNRDIPWEYTRPANGRSYSWTPGAYTSIDVWINDLVKSACGDGNFTLGVSAPATGKFEPELIDKFQQMGAWLNRYGESLFGTRGGPFKRTNQYGTTCKDRKVYLFIYQKDSAIILPPVSQKLTASRMLNGGTVKVAQTESGISVRVDEKGVETPVTIVELEFDGMMEGVAPLGETPINQGKSVRTSNRDQVDALLASDGKLSTGWKSDGTVSQPWIEYDLGEFNSISRAILFEGQEEGSANNIRIARIQVKSGSEWKTVREVSAWGGGSDKFSEWPISVSVPEIRFEPVSTRYIRVLLTKVNGNPSIHEFEVYTH